MSPASRFRLQPGGLAVVLSLPPIAMLALSFVSGGFFPDATAVVTLVALLFLIVRATAAPVPFAGLSPGLSLGAVALVSFAAWTLLSGTWSGSPARALLEYNRTLLYATVFVLFGTLGRTTDRARVLLYGLAFAAVVVSIAACANWLLPEQVPAGADLSRERQGWPTTYWNATGLIAALAVVWNTGITCSATERAGVRVAAAAAVPIGAAALVFTVSRGAASVGVFGLLVVLVATRSRSTVSGLVGVVPGVVGAVLVALGVENLNTHSPSPEALASGRSAALAITAIVLGSAALRAGLIPLDRKLIRAQLPVPGGRLTWAAGIAIAAIAIATFVAVDGPKRVSSAADQLTASKSQSVAGNLPARKRFTELGNNGRLNQWRVALRDGYGSHSLHGTGAGTFAVLWTSKGTSARRILDAHSLYIEQLGELGIVGAVLLLTTLGLMLLALVRRTRSREGAVWGALLAGAATWMVHAGVDWDWEMPALTAWVFAAGGLALSAPIADQRVYGARGIRLAVGLGCLLLAIVPSLVWRSQTRLSAAVDALASKDCRTAQAAALDASAAVSVRPEPFEVLSYCNAALGRLPLALKSIDAAVRRDPDNWELRYAKALIRGSAGLDPRAAAKDAHERNPRAKATQDAVRRFAADRPSEWRRFALSAPLPIPER